VRTDVNFPWRAQRPTVLAPTPKSAATSPGFMSTGLSLPLPLSTPRLPHRPYGRAIATRRAQETGRQKLPLAAPLTAKQENDHEDNQDDDKDSAAYSHGAHPSRRAWTQNMPNTFRGCSLAGVVGPYSLTRFLAPVTGDYRPDKYFPDLWGKRS
jgi:hypothetical protein